jgi:acetylornithine/succinyldiaminopimelate/putrescine aminotransferase
VAGTVLDLTTAAMPNLPIDAWSAGLDALQAKYPQWVVEVRQTGLIFGVKFAHEAGGMLMTKMLFDAGVWAAYAGFDHSVLQVKPGLLMTDAETDEVLAAFDRACAAAAQM